MSKALMTSKKLQKKIEKRIRKKGYCIWHARNWDSWNQQALSALLGDTERDCAVILQKESNKCQILFKGHEDLPPSSEQTLYFVSSKKQLVTE